MVRMRLRRGDVKQIQGPVTGKRYVFERRVGYNKVVEVDDEDAYGRPGARGLIAWTEGCCGGTPSLVFEVVE